MAGLALGLTEGAGFIFMVPSYFRVLRLTLVSLSNVALVTKPATQLVQTACCRRINGRYAIDSHSEPASIRTYDQGIVSNRVKASKSISVVLRLLNFTYLVCNLGFWVRDATTGRIAVSNVHWWAPEIGFRTKDESWKPWTYIERPSEIFTGYMMPGTNGLRSVNAVKTNPKTAMYKLVSRLSLVWFAGAARIGVHSGQCCLTRNQFGSYDISAPSAPINSCEISGGAYGV